MRDAKVRHKKEFIALASWGNGAMGFSRDSVLELCDKGVRMKPYKKYFEKQFGIEKEKQKTMNDLFKK